MTMHLLPPMYSTTGKRKGKMKFKFAKDLDYQQDAVNAIVDIFDTGENITKTESPFELIAPSPVVSNDLAIDERVILKNVQGIQERNSIKPVSTELGTLDFSIEMETGTGKTYVYLRTIHELRLRYGLTKFIVLVPSVAIREGVLKTIEQTRAHFGELYGNEFEYFVYDSSRLSRVREFAQSIYPQVMIMTIQSFNSDNTIMRQSPDRFNGESPLSLVAATRPIVIMDEPQNMESDLAVASIADLMPLCKLRYSATHKEKHNLMYQAVNNRIIIQPDKVNSETSSGLIDTSIEKSKILKGTVVSVGELCNGWQVNDKVIYAKNSGMEMPDGTLNMTDMDIFAKIVEP